MLYMNTGKVKRKHLEPPHASSGRHITDMMSLVFQPHKGSQKDWIHEQTSCARMLCNALFSALDNCTMADARMHWQLKQLDKIKHVLLMHLVHSRMNSHLTSAESIWHLGFPIGRGFSFWLHQRFFEILEIGIKLLRLSCYCFSKASRELSFDLIHGMGHGSCQSLFCLSQFRLDLRDLTILLRLCIVNCFNLAFHFCHLSVLLGQALFSGSLDWCRWNLLGNLALLLEVIPPWVLWLMAWCCIRICLGMIRWRLCPWACKDGMIFCCTSWRHLPKQHWMPVEWYRAYGRLISWTQKPWFRSNRPKGPHFPSNVFSPFKKHVDVASKR